MGSVVAVVGAGGLGVRDRLRLPGFDWVARTTRPRGPTWPLPGTPTPDA